MRSAYIVSIVLLLFVLLCLFTPQIVSDKMYGLMFGDIQYVFYNQNSLCYEKYVLNHEQYDGELSAKCISQKKLQPIILSDYDAPIIHNNQYLNNDRIKLYSNFTSSISFLLNKVMKLQRFKLNVCIIVSVRKDFTKGNHIKFACYSVYPKETVLQIAEKHHSAVKTVQNTKHFKRNTTLGDVFKAMNTDIVMNNWKSLSEITKCDNSKLRRVNYDQLQETDMDQFICSPRNKFLIFDYFQSKYVLTHIRSLT